MKKGAIFLFIFCFVTSGDPIFGQDNNLSLGLTGGLTKSKYTCDCIIDIGSVDQYVYSYLIGVKANYKVSQTVSLSTEIIYDRRGTYQSWSSFRNGNHEGGEIWQYFNYVTVPMLLEITFLPFYMELGPSTIFYLSNDFKYTGDKPETPNDVTHKGINFGILGGLGVRFPIKDQYILNLHARAHKGTQSKDSFGLRTYSLQMGVSYKIQ